MDPLLYEKVNLDPSEKISLQSGSKVNGYYLGLIVLNLKKIMTSGLMLHVLKVCAKFELLFSGYRSFRNPGSTKQTNQ